MSGHCIVEMYDVSDNSSQNKSTQRVAWQSKTETTNPETTTVARAQVRSSMTSSTRAEREQAKKSNICFLKNQLLQQLKQLFKKVCTERKQCWGKDDNEAVIRRHIRQLESRLVDIQDIELDRANFDQQLSKQCQAFVELNATAITACMKFQALCIRRRETS